LFGLEKVLTGTNLFDDINKAKNIIKNEIISKRTLIDRKNNDISDSPVNRKNLFGKATIHKLRKESSVSIPLVESEPLIKTDKSHFATVSKLKIELKKLPKSSQKDEIEFPNILTGNNDSKSHFLALVDIAKKLFLENTGKKLSDNYTLRCNLDNSNLVHGESFDLAFTLLTTANLFKYYGCRSLITPTELTAFTGRLDKDGNILSVEEDGLALKIEAIVFSDYKYFVVPFEHEQFCKRHLEEIEKQNNAKNLLTIIAVRNIKECFYDRRIIESVQISFSVHKVRKIWKRRRPAAAILFLIMSLFIAKVIYGPIDNHPAWIDYEGKELIIKNWAHEELKRIEIGEMRVEQAKKGKENDDLLADTCDTDKDGYKEIIYLEGRNKTTKDESIACYSFRRDSILWRFSLRKEVEIPLNPNPESRFHCWELIVGDYNRNKKPELYVLTSNEYSPSIIFQIDAVNGKELATYVHYGNLSEMMFADINNDGKDELVCCGTNQSFGTACLLVLDPNNMNGHGPVNDLNRIEGWPEAKEVYYLEIPMTIVGKAYSKISSYSQANNMSISKEDEEIRVEIRDAETKSEFDPIMFYIHFGFDLYPRAIAKGDFYNSCAQYLLKEGKISRFPDAAYLEEYKKEIVYLKKPIN